jgi:hypothetical protein
MLNEHLGCNFMSQGGLQCGNSEVSDYFGRSGLAVSFRFSRNPNEVARLRAALDGYLLSMASDSIVNAMVESLECRKTLLEVCRLPSYRPWHLIINTPPVSLQPWSRKRPQTQICLTRGR